MQVTTITVTRERKVQPEQYGSAGASLNLVANLDEGEDWKVVARQLLDDTRNIVYGNLGLKLPARATDGAQDVTTAEPVEAAQPAADDKGKPAARRGRPPTKRGEQPVAAPETPSEPEPEQADPTPAIRATPEGRKNPEDDLPDDPASKPTPAPATGGAAAADDVPEDPTPETAPAAATPAAKSAAASPTAGDQKGDYSASDLQSHLMTLVTKKKTITAQRVREILGEFGVTRTSELKPDQVLDAKAKIDAEATGV